MDRIIEVKVGGNYLSKDNKNAGVRGEANVTALRITFDESWGTYAKKITFWDARGLNPRVVFLEGSLLEDYKKSNLVYLVPIPAEPLREAGSMTFVIDGLIDDKRMRSVSDKLEVKDAPIDDEALRPEEPTPTEVEQLQEQLEELTNTIGEAMEAKELAEDAKESAEASASQAVESAGISVESATLAQESATKALATVGKSSYIGENGNWFAWDSSLGEFYDTGVKAQSGSTVYVGDNPPEDADVWIDPNGDDGVCLASKEDKSNKVKTASELIDYTSEEQYPNCKAVREYVISEVKKIGVGGGGGVGQATSDGSAEVFNDYENNKAYGLYSHAEGSNTTSGIMGYYFTKIDLSEDKLSAIFYLSTKQTGEETEERDTDFYINYSVGDIISYVSGSKYLDIAKITSIDTVNKTITVEALEGKVLAKGAYDTGVDDQIIYVYAKPTNGIIPFGHYAHAEGEATFAVERSSHAEGRKTVARGQHSHTEGRTTKAEGESSHAEGYNTKALGNSSHAEGSVTEARGGASHAEGYYTKAMSAYSHAEGVSSEARGYGSHAEGKGAIAEGFASHAEGQETKAEGESSHAEGYNTVAKEFCSHAEGDSTISVGKCQHVQGKYNIVDSQFAHIVGNGSSGGGRSNAHTIDWNGNAWFAGDVTVGANKEKLATENYDHNKWQLIVSGTLTNDAQRFSWAFEDEDTFEPIKYKEVYARFVMPTNNPDKLSGFAKGRGFVYVNRGTSVYNDGSLIWVDKGETNLLTVHLKMIGNVCICERRFDTVSRTQTPYLAQMTSAYYGITPGKDIGVDYITDVEVLLYPQDGTWLFKEGTTYEIWGVKA